MSGYEVAGHIAWQLGNTNEQWYLAFFLFSSLSIQSRTQACRMLLATFRVDLPSLTKPL